MILQNKNAHPAFSGLLRSKGFFWLATRPNTHGEWSQAGGMLTLQGGGPWFCTVPRGSSHLFQFPNHSHILEGNKTDLSITEEWPQDAEITKAIDIDFQGTWGDRRQEVVFIGLDVDETAVREVFDKCLLTNGEMRRWERVMGNRKYSVAVVEDKLAGMFEGMSCTLEFVSSAEVGDWSLCTRGNMLLIRL